MGSGCFRMLERLTIEIPFLFRYPCHSHKTVEDIIKELGFKGEGSEAVLDDASIVHFLDEFLICL